LGPPPFEHILIHGQKSPSMIQYHDRIRGVSAVGILARGRGALV
jgi:hypothetical protein